MRKTILGLMAVAAGAGLALAQPSATDWPSYGKDEGGARFSPLTQITPQNVDRLKVAWTFHMNPTPGVAQTINGRPVRPPSATVTPLAVNGVLYLATPYGRVVALDAESGKQRWAYALPPRDQPAFRGVSYWPGDKSHAPQILFGTIGGRLIALYARNGAPVKGFGEDGIVDLKTPEVIRGLPQGGYGVTAPGAIYRNLIILGSRLQENPALGPSGAVRAYDVRSGKLAWTFDPIPGPGQKYSETWEGESAKNRSGANVWNLMTVDEKRGIAYLPFGAPAFDRYGGDRKGANLFSDSIVAVNAATGKYLWHFQLTHHDIWDYDLHTAPVLLDVKQNGRTIPAVAAMNKAAFLFLLNRVTGEPIYQVVETPVPASAEPSEQAWPTQPIPVKPPQLARGGFELDEVTDITPAHKAYCENLITTMHLKPTRTYMPEASQGSWSLQFPSSEGGPEWGGGAFDPGLGYFIVNTNSRGSIEQLIKRADGSWDFTGRSFHDPQTRMMCQKTPWGELIAVNVNSGDIAWRVPLGVTDAAPPGKQNTGRVSNGGPILTASGLTFIGGTDDTRFRAFDSRTGKELWTWKLDYSAHATPITWRGKGGKQFVAVVATGGSYLGGPSGGDSLIAFTLP